MQNRWNLAVVLAVALALISCVPDAPEVEHTLGHAGALCGEEQLPAMEAYDALRKGDAEGVAGLASRGKVDFLKPGTTVRGAPDKDGWTYVTVTSGASVGKWCWMPTKVMTLP